ncbi:hypothetical protein VL15_15700 [Burkholderia cepacia]|uniref:Uncharacterized protein n=1 Tax=Burkholderia cepacia TaxID=292 RepID=A0A0J5ZTS8_BURCE|nr:hypothetical protein [Burkholderia cepacia]KML56865.1 hypothetical protein VL15_15700 [Burkholderia cepacia]
MAVGAVAVVPLPPAVDVVPVVEVVLVAEVLVPGDESTSSPPHADKPIAAATKHIINIPK